MPSPRRLARSLPGPLRRALRSGERGLLALASRTAVGRRRIFESYFRSNRWGDPHSVSGRGSSLEHTATIRAELPALFERWSITTLLDVPCGDGYWMQHVDHHLELYTGADVVPAAVEALRSRAREGERYVCLDAISDSLPPADAIFSRDFFIHLSYDHVRAALRNMQRSGATYLIASTYPAHDNTDIVTGEWRPVNLTAEPFSLGEPLELIDERCPAVEYADKALGVWRLDALDLT